MLEVLRKRSSQSRRGSCVVEQQGKARGRRENGELGVRRRGGFSVDDSGDGFEDFGSSFGAGGAHVEFQVGDFWDYVFSVAGVDGRDGYDGHVEGVDFSRCDGLETHDCGCGLHDGIDACKMSVIGCTLVARELPLWGVDAWACRPSILSLSSRQFRRSHGGNCIHTGTCPPN
jgi:hypothetical protein